VTRVPVGTRVTFGAATLILPVLRKPISG